MSRNVVYRMYSREGVLLYIGCSNNIVKRVRTHDRGGSHHGSEWFPQVARIAYQAYRDRETALAAEKDAIRTLRPLKNVLHNPAARWRAALPEQVAS